MKLQEILDKLEAYRTTDGRFAVVRLATDITGYDANDHNLAIIFDDLPRDCEEDIEQEDDLLAIACVLNERLNLIARYQRPDGRYDLPAVRAMELRSQGKDDTHAFFEAIFSDKVGSGLLALARAETTRVVRKMEEEEEQRANACRIGKLRAGCSVSTEFKHTVGEQIRVWGFLCEVMGMWWREAEEEELYDYTGWMVKVQLVEPPTEAQPHGSMENTHPTWETEEHLARCRM